MNILETLPQFKDFLSESNYHDCIQMQQNEHNIYFNKVDDNHGNIYVESIADNYVAEKISLVNDMLIARMPFLSLLIDTPKVIPTRQSGIIGYLASLFGHNRFERICQKTGIDLRFRSDNFLCLYEIEAFCLHAAEVYEDDLKELLNEIKSDSKTIRFLNEHKSAQCRKNFEKVHSLDSCSNHHLEQLLSLLIPHVSILELFSKSVPDKEIWKKIDLYEKMRRSPPSEYQWFMTVVKRIVDREVTEGVVFRNSHSGFCKIHRIVSGSGAFKCFLKHIGKESNDLPNVVAYRGTCPREPSTFVEDLRQEFGSQGPKLTFMETDRLLMDPESGFVKSRKERVIAIGMSLGACQLMRDALLFGSKMCRVIAFAGPGPDKKSMELYAKVINERKAEDIKIEHWWESDDVIPCLGNVHLGAGCEPSKINISINILELEDLKPNESIENRLKRIAEKMRFPSAKNRRTELWQAITRLQSVLEGPHCRNTFEGNYRVFHLNNQDNPELVDRLLNHDPELLCDPKWEEMRQMVAIKSDEPFADFANNFAAKGLSRYSFAPKKPIG